MNRSLVARSLVSGFLALLPWMLRAETRLPVVIAGGQVQTLRPGDKLALPAATATSAPLSLPPGVDPSNPADGDIWTTATDGLRARINGTVTTYVPALWRHGNPTIAAALIGIGSDSLGTLANTREVYTLSGERAGPNVGRSIEIIDGQSGPASRQTRPTAQSASYGLSVVGMRPSWNTSSITGEMDGINLFLRQANGDSAAILSNILIRRGFAATLESFTGSADSLGNALKAVNLQMGVVNSRDGGEYGYNAQAITGTNLTAAFRAASLGSASWTDFFQGVDSNGSVIAEIRASDGAFIGGSIAPRTSLGADIGSERQKYSNSWVRFSHLDPTTYTSLPNCNADNAGTLAYITDASAPISAWHQQVRGGGGTNRAFITCNGSGWFAFSY